MPKLSYCSLESFKTWRDNSIVGEGIPLDNCQGKEGILIGILLWICRNVMELNLDDL